jgi:hypothetical protein
MVAGLLRRASDTDRRNRQELQDLMYIDTLKYGERTHQEHVGFWKNIGGRGDSDCRNIDLPGAASECVSGEALDVHGPRQYLSSTFVSRSDDLCDHQTAYSRFRYCHQW